MAVLPSQSDWAMDPSHGCISMQASVWKNLDPARLVLPASEVDVVEATRWKPSETSRRRVTKAGDNDTAFFPGIYGYLGQTLESDKVVREAFCGRFVPEPGVQFVALTKDERLFLGQVKVDEPANQSDEDSQLPQAQYEELADTMVPFCNTVQVLDGSRNGELDDIFITTRLGSWKILRCSADAAPGSYQIKILSSGTLPADFRCSDTQALRASLIVRVTSVDDRLLYQILYMVEDGTHAVLTMGRYGEKYLDDFRVLPDIKTDELLPLPPDTCFTEIIGHIDEPDWRNIRLVLVSYNNATDKMYYEFFPSYLEPIKRSLKVIEYRFQGGPVFFFTLPAYGSFSVPYLGYDGEPLNFQPVTHVFLDAAAVSICFFGPMGRTVTVDWSSKGCQLPLRSAAEISEGTYLTCFATGVFYRVTIKDSDTPWKLSVEVNELKVENAAPLRSLASMDRLPGVHRKVSSPAVKLRRAGDRHTFMLFGVFGEFYLLRLRGNILHLVFASVTQQLPLVDAIAVRDSFSTATNIYCCESAGRATSHSGSLGTESTSSQVANLDDRIARLTVGNELEAHMRSTSKVSELPGEVFATAVRAASDERLLFAQAGPAGEACLGFREKGSDMKACSLPFDVGKRGEQTISAALLQCGAFVQVKPRQIVLFWEGSSGANEREFPLMEECSCDLASILACEDLVAVSSSRQRTLSVYRVSEEGEGFKLVLLCSQDFAEQPSALTVFGSSPCIALVSFWNSSYLSILNCDDNLEKIGDVGVGRCATVRSIIALHKCRATDTLVIFCGGSNGKVATMEAKLQLSLVPARASSGHYSLTASFLETFKIGRSEVRLVELSPVSVFGYIPGRSGSILSTSLTGPSDPMEVVVTSKPVVTRIHSFCKWGVGSSKFCWLSEDGYLCFGDFSEDVRLVRTQKRLPSLSAKRLFHFSAENLLILFNFQAEQEEPCLSIIDEQTLDVLSTKPIGPKFVLGVTEICIPTVKRRCIVLLTSDKASGSYSLLFLRAQGSDDDVKLEIAYEDSLSCLTCTDLSSAAEGALVVGTEAGLIWREFVIEGKRLRAWHEMRVLEELWIHEVRTHVMDNGRDAITIACDWEGGVHAVFLHAGEGVVWIKLMTAADKHILRTPSFKPPTFFLALGKMEQAVELVRVSIEVCLDDDGEMLAVGPSHAEAIGVPVRMRAKFAFPLEFRCPEPPEDGKADGSQLPNTMTLLCLSAGGAVSLVRTLVTP